MNEDELETDIDDADFDLENQLQEGINSKIENPWTQLRMPSDFATFTTRDSQTEESGHYHPLK